MTELGTIPTNAALARMIGQAARTISRGATVIMPWVNNWPMTERAAVDALDQTAVGQVGLILHHNGGIADAPASSAPAGEHAAACRFSGARVDVLCLATTRRPLGSVWNADLKLAAARPRTTDALVVNNDVRLHPLTYFYLRMVAQVTGALFVGALNCAAEGVTWEELRERRRFWPPLAQVVRGAVDGSGRGGPDFSCFLITKECWEKYAFDPVLTYFGDNDYHRQLTLGGDGSRIFGACVPYWHIGSQTIASATDETRAALRTEFEAHRQYYREKWGGLVGGEQYNTPWNGRVVVEGERG